MKPPFRSVLFSTIQFKIQVEFDKHFGYITPDVENKLVHHSARFFGRFVRPFTDFSSFWKTLLSFLPILQWLPRYNIKDNLLHDMIGGLMVGVMHVPQGSFAVVALVTGNAVSNLIVSKTGDTNATHANVSLSLESDIKPIDVTTALCLAIGMTQVIIATIGLDFVTTYLSEQLVAGFVTGAAVHVFVTQLKDITGIYGTPRRAGLGNAILVRGGT
ncbi:unnamed protein product [Heligmosomoides polygyrus]|uniref:SLC26A/SulP transporter domain-containing protein n=1 Tax=Heligmosomoides polygyrus TaxID=6339 RepID=A0A3P8AKR2_HELPZ|nr:unnamed protein product [Heligmosomoides polygyrus]